MTLKTYVVTDENGNYVYIEKSYRPKNVIKAKLKYKDLEPGVLEDPRWLQLEQIADPKTGELVPTFTVDEIKKAQVLADEAAEKDAKEAEETAKQATRDALLDKLVALDVDAVTDLEGIKEIFKDLRDYFLYKYDADIKVKKEKDKVKKVK